MSFSPNRLALSSPQGNERIPAGTLGYMRAEVKSVFFDCVLGEFEKSNISQKDLADRIGKGEAQISRYLGSPGNWTLDTVAELLFGISGATVKGILLDYPCASQQAKEMPRSEAGTSPQVKELQHGKPAKTNQKETEQTRFELVPA
jgi:hypothetical protein